MKLNPEQRLIVYIALLWAYENKEEGVAIAPETGRTMGLCWTLSEVSGWSLDGFPEVKKLNPRTGGMFWFPKDESGRLSRISLLEKAIKETEMKIYVAGGRKSI